MTAKKFLIALSLVGLPLSAHAQAGRPSVPPPVGEQAQAAPAQVAPAPSADAIADRATQTLRCQTESDPDLAIGGCSALIQSGALSDAALGAIFVRRAALYSQQGNNQQALKDLTLAMQLVRPDAALYALKGRVTQALEMRADAIENYKQCLARDANNAECGTNLSLLQNNSQQENEACNASGAADAVITACNTLIQRYPSVARYFNARGVAYFTKRDYRRALEDFTAALRLSPQDTVMLTNRCNAYIQVRQFDRAIDDCDDALRAKRDNAQALYARGIAKFSREDADGALSDFNAAMDRNPAQPALVLGYRGAAFLKKGDLTAAQKDLNEALRLMPESAGARAYLGGFYVALKQPDNAIKELDQALRLNPFLVAARIYRGQAYIQKKQDKRGFEDLDAAVKLEPDNAFVFQARGQVYASLGQSEKAASDFRACRILDLFATCGGKIDLTPVSVPAAPEKAAAPKPAAAKPTTTAAKPPTAKPAAKAPAPNAKPAAKPAATAKPPAKPPVQKKS